MRIVFTFFQCSHNVIEVILMLCTFPALNAHVDSQIGGGRR